MVETLVTMSGFLDAKRTFSVANRESPKNIPAIRVTQIACTIIMQPSYLDTQRMLA
jgi:hypothetical protein